MPQSRVIDQAGQDTNPPNQGRLTGVKSQVPVCFLFIAPLGVRREKEMIQQEAPPSRPLRQLPGLLGGKQRQAGQCNLGLSTAGVLSHRTAHSVTEFHDLDSGSGNGGPREPGAKPYTPTQLRAGTGTRRLAEQRAS